jgi:hypothetical protein
MTGQINYEFDELGRYIVDLCKNPEIKTIVEIGTWNGLGTTRCILHGLKESNKVDYNVYSLECWPDMHATAIKNNAANISDRFQIIHGKIADENLLTSWFDDSILNTEQKGWLREDKERMAQTPNVLAQIPNQIDFLILDGGEFSTYLEWQILKDRFIYCALDDTRELKCSKIREEVYNDSHLYEVIADDTAAKNGFMVFKKK